MDSGQWDTVESSPSDPTAFPLLVWFFNQNPVYFFIFFRLPVTAPSCVLATRVCVCVVCHHVMAMKFRIRLEESQAVQNVPTGNRFGNA